MHTSVEIGENFEATLTKAILLYAVKGSTAGSWCGTVHDVKDRALGAGTPVTSEFLRSLRADLDGKPKHSIQFLPPNVLSTGDALMWWTPAVDRRMFFGGRDDEVKHLDGKLLPHPALLWGVYRSRLTVRALWLSDRPAPATKLAVAPYWNVGPDGFVCQGSMRSPKGCTVDTIPKWEEAFFRSRFTHANVGKLTSHVGGFVGLWSELKQGGTFPERLLLPASQTAERFLGALCTR